MNLQTVRKTARDWKHELRQQIRPHDKGDDMAVIAWEVVGGIAALVALYGIVTMMPELVRYMKIKRM